MKSQTIGKRGPSISVLGLGCNGMSLQQPRNDDESIATIQAALDAGFNLLNTADFYGMGHNETIVGRAIRGRRDQAFVSVKCGFMMSPTRQVLGLDGRPASVKNFCSYSLQRLGVDVIDLYAPCRADPAVPYEDTIGAVADLINDGKVRYLGVSEVGAALLRRAHAVHPVTALEIEYSLACRFIEREILPVTRELGVGIIPYRVLADGLLSGAVTSEPTSPHAHLTPPRLKGEHLQHNLGVVTALMNMANAKGCSPAQLAIAWLLTRGDDIFPIVGMSRRARLPDTLAVLDITLDAADLSALDEAFAPGAITGERYPAFVQKFAAA